MNVGYIISSHKAYKLPLLHLLKSMAYYGVTSDRMFIVRGGVEEVAYDTQFREVTHNSFDFTGLIEFVQQSEWLPEYVMTLQDTMEFTFQTHALIQLDINSTKDAIAVFGGQCNLVLYRRDYLLEMCDFILARKNMSKLQSIQEEGILWKILPEHKRGHYPNGTMDILWTNQYPYGTHIPRIVEQYNAIKLLKYKANHGQNMYNLITEP